MNRDRVPIDWGFTRTKARQKFGYKRHYHYAVRDLANSTPLANLSGLIYPDKRNAHFCYGFPEDDLSTLTTSLRVQLSSSVT